MANITVISIGSMGLGVAKLLQAHDHHIFTALSGRSAATMKRAESAGINALLTESSIISESDYIISIVPPAEALPMAQRIVNAFRASPSARYRKPHPLYYLDLNAVSPRTARSLSGLFASSAPQIRFIDGGIIGGPPSLKASENSDGHDLASWYRPSIPLSGPYKLSAAPVHGAEIAAALNTKYLGSEIGTASGLKCSFASLTKGLTALAIQSFSTAQSLGVLPELQEHLAEYSPMTGKLAAKGVVGMPSKASRWIGEMREINECHSEEGGWGQNAEIFEQIAQIYEVVGKEVENRGGTEGMEHVEGVIEAAREGLDRSV